MLDTTSMVILARYAVLTAHPALQAQATVFHVILDIITITLLKLVSAAPQ